MDPDSAKLALALQLDDIETYRKTLPRSTASATVFSEAMAFEQLRGELLRKLWEVNGYVHDALEIYMQQCDGREMRWVLRCIWLSFTNNGVCV